MKRMTAIGAAAGLGSLIAVGGALAQQKTDIGALAPHGNLTISGKVTDVFGNKFVVEDKTGRVLVETGPHRGRQFDIQKGEDVTVTGLQGPGGGFDAFTLKRGDAAPIEIRRPEGPPPRAGRGPDRAGPAGPGPGGRGGYHAEVASPEVAIRRAEEAGMRDVRIGERKRHHYEATATDRNKRAVDVHIHDDGEIKLMEDGYGPRGHLMQGDLGDAELRRIVEDNGYKYLGGVERHPKHVEVLAENPQSERVELHIDRAGDIYKEERRFW